MKIDMHFYGVYALARAAGIKAETAETIAHASQYVDDAIEDDAIVLPEGGALLPIVTAHKALDIENVFSRDQWKVWVAYHFIPGNQGTGDEFDKRMVCREDSAPAKKVLEHALSNTSEPFGPHLAGIAAHAYADTFSHYGFSGLGSHLNRVRHGSIEMHTTSDALKDRIALELGELTSTLGGALASFVPVGHSSVVSCPDQSYLHWSFVDYAGGRQDRHNADHFVASCKELYAYYCRFLLSNPEHGEPTHAKTWDTIHSLVRLIIETEASSKDLCQLWSRNMFPDTDHDQAVRYAEGAWKSASIADYYRQHGTLDGCDGYHFIQAAQKHRDYMLQDLLPSIGLIRH